MEPGIYLFYFLCRSFDLTSRSFKTIMLRGLLNKLTERYKRLKKRLTKLWEISVAFDFEGTTISGGNDVLR